MNIIDNRDIKKVQYYNVKIGEVFCKNDKYYMKTDVSNGPIEGAIELSSGKVKLNFVFNEEVEIINADLVLNN